MATEPNVSQSTVRLETNLALSYSVETTIKNFPEKSLVPAWMLVQDILSRHHEYDQYLHLETDALFRGLDPNKGVLKPASTWLKEVISLYDPQKLKRLNFEPFVLGLSEIDTTLANHLDFNSTGFRDALKRELQEPYESLLRTSTGSVAEQNATASPAQNAAPGTEFSPPPPPSSSDYIVFRADAATAADQLGRQGFADALATWLNRIWGENYMDYLRLRVALEPESRLPEGGSFIVHLHGPWGAGKTSLLRLMENALRNINLSIGGEPREWTVVWFNAWRNRHLDPAWWPLMERVYQETVNHTASPTETRLQESWWRARITGLGQYVLAIGVAFVLLGLGMLAVSSRGEGDLFGSLIGLIGTVSTIIGFVGSIVSIVLAVSRSVSSGSAASAQNFLRLAQDPMEKVRVHFSEILDRVNGPVMVLIDDMDRCQPEYVVRLLESIQTLFNDSRVFYVIAADRRWLYECFEIVYQNFTKSIREPGRRTGYLFLEKIFQMSISVPAMSAETQKAYLDTLYRGERADAGQKIAEAAREAEVEFEQVTSTEALIEKLKPTKAQDPIVQQARREAAVRRLASQEVSADIEHFLQPFASLLERNPRAMKRLVNAYSVYLALAVLADVELINSPDKKKRFALWTILSLRWPSLAEKLEQDPETLPTILKRETDGLDPELAALIREGEVQRVLHGEAKGIGVSLDEETIAGLLGLQASSSTPAVA